MTTTKAGDRATGASPAGDGAPAEDLGSETRRWSSASTASSRRAYERRNRRRRKMSDDRLVRPGRKVSSAAFNRAPFVVGLIALLGLGVTAVLWLNTLTDEAGMRTSTAKSRTTDLRLTIEQLRHDVAMLDATPRIAEQAKALGMVQAGDSAMLMVDGSGQGTVVGEPSYVPAPAPTTAAPTAAAPADQPAAAAPADQPAAPSQTDPGVAPSGPTVTGQITAAAPSQPSPAAPAEGDPVDAGAPQGAGG